MNKLQKMMALSFAFVLLVTNFGGNAKSFAQESSNETMVSNTAQVDPIDPASLVISIRGAKPKKVSSNGDMTTLDVYFKRREKDTNKVFINDIMVAEGYSVVFTDYLFTESSENFIQINDSAPEPKYFKLKKDALELKYTVRFTQELEEVEYTLKSVLGIPLDEKMDKSNGKSIENRKKLTVNLPAESKITQVEAKDILTDETKRDALVEFYGKDATFKTEEKNPIPLEEGKITTIYFKLVTAVPLESGEVDEPKYYEVRIEKKSAPDKKEENKSSAASSPRSSVRPDRASAAPSTNNTMPTTEKNEAKTMPNTENKKAMPSENASAMTPKASAPKTFKLVLGKKQYTSTQEGAMTDKALDVAPMISKGRVMLSARAISGLLGLTTQYNPSTKTAIFSDEANNRIELPLGKDYLLVNGEKMMLTSLPVNQQGRVLLPITDIQKAFKKLGTQAEITWNKEDKSILIQK